MPKTPNSPRISYEIVGDSGSPVLLIMGFGMRGRVWQPQLDDLAQHHRCLIFDHRGVGQSETDGGLWRMSQLADDARRVLDAAGWERAHLVGVSMGGMIAQELALACPDRFQSLSLIATHAGGPTAWLPTPEGARRFLRAGSRDPQTRLRAIQHLLYPPQWLASADQAAVDTATAARSGSPAPKPTMRAQLHAVVRHDTRRRLGALTLPTLVIKPGADILVRPKHSDDLLRRLPNATLLTYDDGGHGLVYQYAASVNQALLEHFGLTEESPIQS